MGFAKLFVFKGTPTSLKDIICTNKCNERLHLNVRVWVCIYEGSVFSNNKLTITIKIMVLMIC